MKTLKYLLIIAIISCMSGKTFGEEPVRGTIQFNTNGQTAPGGAGSSVATAVIPVPAQGAPNQIKAIITKKVTPENEKKVARFVFILPVEKQKKGASFSVREGKIIAAIGAMDPQNEQVSIFLVYRGVSQEGKAAFSQIKVELMP